LCRFDYREELCDGDYENDEDFEHVGYISEGEGYSNSVLFDVQALRGGRPLLSG
jgi:hypothetical protein